MAGLWALQLVVVVLGSERSHRVRDSGRQKKKIGVKINVSPLQQPLTESVACLVIAYIFPVAIFDPMDCKYRSHYCCMTGCFRRLWPITAA